MRRSLRILPAFLLVLVVAAACTNAKVGAPSPDGIQISTNGSIVVAGDNNVAVRAQVFEKGVVLLGQSVTFSVAGAPDQVATTSSATGFALASFSLHTAGAATVTATVIGANGPISSSTGVTVLAAPSASLALSLGQSPSADVGTLSFTATAKDAYQNVTNDPIGVAVDSPGAAVQGSTVSNLHTAGNFKLRATVENYSAVTSSAGFTVLAGASAQAVANATQSVVGKLQTLSFSCDEKDAWGNSTGSTFAATTNAFTTPASTITALGGNHFIASGFTVTGFYQATCSLNSHTDAKQFQVLPQSGSNSVVASLDRTLVQASSGTATLTCTEVDGLGNAIAATLTGSLTDPSSVTTTLGGSSPFTLNTFTTTGFYTATCTDAANSLSDSKTIDSVDTKAPGVDVSIVAASGANGITADGRYAPGTNLTVRVHATDNVRVASEALSMTGPVVAVGSDIHAETTSTNNATFDFIVHVLDNAPSFAPVTIHAAATDGSGNSSVSATSFSLAVDSAAGFATGTGVTVRTVFEQKTSLFPVAIGTSGANVYVTEEDDIGASATFESTMIDFPAATAGTAFTLVRTNFEIGADLAVPDIVWVPGGFTAVTHTLFEPINGGGGEILEFTAGTPGAFNPNVTLPRALAYGTVGTTTALLELDASAPNITINFVKGQLPGDVVPFFVDSTNALSGFGLAIDSLGNVLATGSGTGTNVYSLNGTAPSIGAPLLTAPSMVYDLAVGSAGKILVLTSGRTLERYDSAGGSQLTAVTFPSSSSPGQVTTDLNGTCYVLSRDFGTDVRVYKVTGY